MENSEGEIPPPKTPGGMSRRLLLRVGLAAGVVTAAALGLKASGIGEKEKESGKAPSFDDIEAGVNRVYRKIGQEVPEEVLKRLPVCNEQGIPPDADYVRTVLTSCGEVGAAVRDLYRDRKDDYFRKVLFDIEAYANAKIDKFVAEHRFPDPKNIDGYRNGLQVNYFTP